MDNTIKETLNKIDYNLTECFENVIIEQLENTKVPMFKATVNGLKSNKDVNGDVIFTMEASGINEGSVMWDYKINPLDENSETIKKVSTLVSIPDEIADILKKQRFSKEYITHLDSEKVLNESSTNDDSEDIETTESENFEFNIGDKVLFGDKRGEVISGDKLSVSDIEYVIYQVSIDGETFPVFEYDLTEDKK